MGNTSKKKALIVSLEGIDGCGKTTQIPLLLERFTKLGYKACTIRDPGGSKISEQLREILKHHDPKAEVLDPKAEVMLFLASRAQMVSQALIPKLYDHDLILLDRFVDSTMVYQGWMNKVMNIDDLWKLCYMSCHGHVPDFTFILDINPEIAKARRIQEGSTKPDKYDDKSTYFHESLHRCYMDNTDWMMFNTNRDIFIIGADTEPDMVCTAIASYITEELLDRRSAVVIDK